MYLYTHMRINYCFLILCICLLSFQVHSQRQKSTYSYKYKSVRIPRQKALIVCPIFKNSEYPYHGIGIKVGDPVAITYKYYKNEKFAVSIDVGSAASGLYTKHHTRNFDQNLPDSLSRISSIKYVRHEVITEYAIEAKLLYHMKVDKIFPRLQSYIGVGWQFRKTDIRYAYLYEILIRDRESGEFVSNKTTHGSVVTVGLEYAYFKLPVSAFIETTLFTDIAANPGWNRFQGGVGIRYVF